jgi:hypothetical protein
MKRLIVLAIVLAGSLRAPAQGAPPAQMYICIDPHDCILVARLDGVSYGGFTGIGFRAWNFNIDAWGPNHIALTGVSTEPDANGKIKILVVKGTRDGREYGLAHAKERDISDPASKPVRVTVRWNVPGPKLTGQWVH